MATFATSLGFEFCYDDHWTIVDNLALERPLGSLLLATLTGRGVAEHIPDSTRPGMIASMWIDRRIFLLAPEGFHLHSLLAYALTTALAVAAVFFVTRRVRIAFVAGLFFAVAPVHAEVVAAVNYREDLIASVGTLAGLAWFFAPRAGSEPLVGVAIAASLWLLGLSGKESAASLVLVVAALAAIERKNRAWWRARRATMLAFGAVGVVWVGWRAWLRAAGLDDVPLQIAHHGFVDRLLRTSRYAVRLIIEAVAPVFWSPDYATERTASPLWTLALAAILALLWILARHRATRVPAMGIAIALIAPLTTSPLLGPVNERTDRYAFLAVLGGGLVWGWIADRLAREVPRASGFVALSAPILALAWVSQSAAKPWRNDLALWSIATERAPQSVRAWTGLSIVLRLSNKLSAAHEASERGVKLDPRYLRGRVERLYLRLREQDLAGARSEIADIERLGGKKERGMEHALACARLSSTEASMCIDGPR